ncbi:hypothetical protein FXO38_15310 [Capsicum annuum]|nr:hypothetical protein FXO38_15310 [Capsicum annuum]
MEAGDQGVEPGFSSHYYLCVFDGKIERIWGLPKLEIINVVINEFGGSITYNIGRAKTLGEIYVANNRISGELLTKISNATSLVRIELSNNRFSGEIPGKSGSLKRLNGYKEHKRLLKQNSWNTKSFHILTSTEDEILDRIKHDNLIGKSGSGSVYRVQLSVGTDFSVKHIWTSDSENWKISGTTSPMLGKPGKKSKEFEAEVETLSSIRHVNRVNCIVA